MGTVMVNTSLTKIGLFRDFTHDILAKAGLPEIHGLPKPYARCCLYIMRLYFSRGAGVMTLIRILKP